MEKFDGKMKKVKKRVKDNKILQSDLEEIIDDVEFTEEEYNKFVEKVIEKGIVVIDNSDESSLEVEKEMIEEEKMLKKNKEDIKRKKADKELNEQKDNYYDQDIMKQYFNEISKYDILTPKEEVELVKRYNDGDSEAKEKLITANLRLVAKIALKYAKMGVFYLDLVQDGTIGLMKAIKKFDVSKGYKLSTYATWWIKKEIIDSLKEKVNFIRIPNYIFLTYQKIVSADKKISQREGRKAKNEEIAIELEMDLSEVNKIKNAVESKLITLNTGSSENKDSLEIEDNRTEEEINEEIENMNRKVKVSNMLQRLNARERKIIELYFGLSADAKKYTFKEIGEVLSLSSERVRVLKEKAIRKLRYVGIKLWSE